MSSKRGWSRVYIYVHIYSIEFGVTLCVGTLSSHVSKASQLKIKAQIQYNPLRFQQSPFNHHYKSIEKGATYEESNKSYVVKAVTVPSSESESEAFNSNNIVHSVKNFMAVLYQFINPYAMYGRSSAAISASLVAVQCLSDITPLFFIGLLQALIPHLFMDLYVNGVNQVFDFEIDKGLGLNLMIGSTALIWNFVLSATLWTCYSVNCLGNVVLGSILWYQTKYVDVTNPASTRSFYSLNWKEPLSMSENNRYCFP
ncbi:Glycinol 4-dimethylallyltransferase [Vigna angularis]|uniref:Glycinol 4-dimethylallyltransferase n=1 Tax=Phaseolus angularis TaxID=3914 RepID=A0A8T0KV15_PHAAN|nr:Glycinol 4-dimethylallyltransferase [Vigna angularis]